MQTYVDLGTTTEPVTVATISSLVGQAQTKGSIPPATAASVLDFLQTSGATAVVTDFNRPGHPRRRLYHHPRPRGADPVRAAHGG